jgi:type IX secretion system substrate protein
VQNGKVRKALILLLICISNAGISYCQYTSVSYYVVAHPDDWQLFMGVNAFNDIIPGDSGTGTKVVFIYTTAGEANCEGNGVDTGYYLSRQGGANRSVQFCADIHSPHALQTSSVVTVHGINDHNVLRFEYKNVVSYFLRLPDGCMEAVHSTIKKLRDGTISSISAVDGSTSYSSYEDLLQTVGSIITNENAQVPEVWINAPDWDNASNPVDHPDHMETGLLAATVSTRTGCSNLALFEGYNTSNEPSNLSPEEVAMEAGLHSQVSYWLTHNSYGTEWDQGAGHVEWTSRNYFRVFNLCGTTTVKDNLKKFVTNTSSSGFYVNLYPNPAQATINMTYLVMENGIVNMSLFNADGRLAGAVLNESKERGVYTASYSISDLPPGVYFLKVRSAQNVKTIQFVKR